MKIFVTLLMALMLGDTTTTPIKLETKASKHIYISNYENVLGTSLEIKVTATEEEEAARAEIAVLKEIDRLASMFSSYDANSEFNKWMKKGVGKPTKISSELFELLMLFDHWKEQTNGALNPSAAVAINLWKEAEKKQRVPKIAEINNAAGLAQLTHYRLDKPTMTAIRLTNVPLVLNTFAKSYIVNKACDVALLSSSINGIVVNIGGDLVVKGDVVDRVNITNPRANAENDIPLAKLFIGNRAVATSGNYRRGMQIGKRWYSHIVDPRTGRPVDGVMSATVVASCAVDAGALATAFNVLKASESVAIAKTIPGIEYFIITTSGKRIVSAGFDRLLAPDELMIPSRPTLNTSIDRVEKTWDPKYELAINFQFNAIEGNSHRPFAAIWVEDANKVVVRNLALWYNKPKWIPDLRNWYRINGEKFKMDKNNYASVTGATRNPGKYTIKWDGKNDAGAYVPQGKYTIIIETAKEHGTDEILRQEMELKKTPKKVSAPGNVEFSNVNFDFHKK